MADAAPQEKKEEVKPVVEEKDTGSQKPMLLVLVLVLNMLVMAAVVGIVYTSYKADRASVISHFFFKTFIN